MTTLNSLQEVAEALNNKYTSINDFRVIVLNEGTIRGGFYKMNYNNTPSGEYYFHETFGRIDENYGVKTFNDLFERLDNIIQKQLKWQKCCDESYAKEFKKNIEYKFDYSAIFNEN